MASDFIPNSFQTPNAYIDRFMAFLTDAELRILMYSVRRIFGFHKRSDRISLSQFISGIVSSDGERLDFGCGINSRATVIATLKSLERIGLMVRVSSNDRFNNGTEWALQLDSDKVDMGYLLSRDKKQKNKNISRTHKARSMKTGSEVVSPTTPPEVVSPTTLPWLVGQHYPGSSDNTGVVSGTDSQYTSLNPDLKPVEREIDAPSPDFDSMELSEVLNVPEIAVYRSICDRTPGKAQYKIIYKLMRTVIEKFGHKTRGETIVYLTPFWEEWVTRDYRPGNLGWLKDWATEGEITTPGKNGKKPAQSTKDHSPNPEVTAKVEQYYRDVGILKD